MGKWYKVLDKYNCAKDGGTFDYTPYLDGTPVPIINDLKKCESGYHITKYWNMWLSSEDNNIYEVEPIGLVEDSEVGVVDKGICKSFKIINKLSVTYDNKSNTGDWNIGNCNTGDRNTGALNTIKPKVTQLFNKNISMRRYEKIRFPNYFYFELKKDYKKSWIESFNKASKEEIKDTIKLPNFSYTVFAKITGITKKMIQERLK